MQSVLGAVSKIQLRFMAKCYWVAAFLQSKILINFNC